VGVGAYAPISNGASQYINATLKGRATCVPVFLCSCALVFLCSCVPVLLCSCALVLLCSCAPVFLCLVICKTFSVNPKGLLGKYICLRN